MVDLLQALVAVIVTRWESASTSYADFSPPINGALFLRAMNGSIPASSTPLQITVYIPQMVSKHIRSVWLQMPQSRRGSLY